MVRLEPFSISLEGRHLVEASAGTGKTYNITSFFIRYIVEERFRVNEILVLTYTKAATAELKERILARLRESITVLRTQNPPNDDDFLKQLLEAVDNPQEAIQLLEQAIHNFDEASIFTIHGFCQRALQEQSFLSGLMFDTELKADDSEIIQEAVDDYWRRLTKNAEHNLISRIWLNILEENGFTPGCLMKIVSAGIGKPYLRFAAESPQGDSRSSALEALQDLYAEIKSTWHNERETISRLLVSEPMSGRRYREDWVISWNESMADWMEWELPTLNYPDKFDRYTIDFIREHGPKKGMEAPEHPFFHQTKSYLRQVERVRSWLPDFKIEMLNYARGEVRKKKLSSGELSYDDFLVLLKEALNHPQKGTELASHLRSKYPVALVDEFQDTDPVQYAILDAIYLPGISGTGLFLIGDPKQSIYSFRGADVYSYLEARDHIPEKQQYGLDRNFRSTPSLINAINAIWRGKEAPFMIDDIRFHPAKPGHKTVPPLLRNGEEGPPVTFLQSGNLHEGEQLRKGDAQARSACMTAKSIARLLDEGANDKAVIGGSQVKPKDVAVLVRTHKQAALIMEELLKRGLKSVQYTRQSVFGTEEAGTVELLLKAIAEPKNESRVRTALSTDLFPYTAGDLIGFDEEEQKWIDIMNSFSEWNRIWQERGFAVMFRTFLKEEQVEKELVSLGRGERKLTNILQVGELLQEREQRENAGVFELIRWLAHKRSEPDRNAEDELLRLESDEELIKVVTMHRSKGLEYPVVYCPFLWHGAHFKNEGEPFIYHDPEYEGRASLELNEKGLGGRENHRYQAALEELSESLRLAYVAMTRAQQQCFIVFESANEMEFSSLGYLLIGKNAVEEQLKGKIYSEWDADDVNSRLYIKALEHLITENSSLLNREIVDDESLTIPEIGDEEGSPAETNRQVTRRKEIVSPRIVSSFSSIMHPSGRRVEEDAISDEFYLPEEFSPIEKDGERTVFTFPKGPGPGSCIHNIFEHIQFKGVEINRDIVPRMLEQFGIATEWEKVVEQMVQTVLQTELKQGTGIRLEKVGEEDLVKEMEFYFDINDFYREKLIQVIRSRQNGTGNGMYKVPKGFMKGYIDLVFRQNGKFYMLDYKTNYLGDSPADYERDVLAKEMEKTGYDVQYHIYTVALHRFLEHTLEEYDYEEHFGGVYYLFVRGMGHTGKGEGIYLDRPGEQLITELDQLFRKGGDR